MKDARFAFGEHIVPLLAPVDSAATDYASPYVNLKDALHCTFFVYFGVVTATSADQNLVVTIESSTAATSNATETALPFSYRLSGATGTDTWGAITTVTATGVSLDTTTVDGKMLAIDVNPAIIEATHGQRDAKFVRVVVNLDAGNTVDLNAIWAEVDPMYPQVTHISTS
jgi:pyruvate-formate lyase